jgi:hypothetical protein
MIKARFVLDRSTRPERRRARRQLSTDLISRKGGRERTIPKQSTIREPRFSLSSAFRSPAACASSREQNPNEETREQADQEDIIQALEAKHAVVHS